MILIQWRAYPFRELRNPFSKPAYAAVLVTLIDGEHGDNCGVGEGQAVEGSSKKGKGLMDMNNSVVIVGWGGCKGTKW